MPSISPKDLKVLDMLSKEYRIVFAGHCEPDEWPECHKTVLGHVSELGEKKFQSYATDANTTDETPWKSNVKFLANNLVARAKRNVKRNESSWRMSCEPLIFARLSGEVVCRNCRKRIWRSEIEASCVINTQRRLALQKRQEAREPCRCPRIARSQDHLEAIGLNRIFGHREDEVVRHDPVVARRLGKRIQKPDAIYGLRQTRNIENFLHDTRKSEARQLVPTDGKQLHEELDPSPIDQPLDQNGDELLYPFLVLEAKSGTSDCDWHSIQLQTAFTIRTFLDTQHRLRMALGPQKQSQQAPLVWFFANKGEDWRISVAYMAEDTQKRNTIGHKDYVIIDVWQGSIVTRDGALQLLLLVDYVFDWARDVYREDIIRKLRLLASGDNDAASILYTDTDIFSTRQVDLSEMHTSAVGNEDYEAYMSAQQAFVALDSRDCVVRHATFVESRYCCVFVTLDNVSTMLRSTKQTRTQKLCRMILGQMSKSMLLDQSALEAVEERWTNTVRLASTAVTSTAQFYTAISCTNYLSGSWHQVRELYIIAIAKDAWDVVVEGSGFKSNRRKPQKPTLAKGADVDTLLEHIDCLQAGTPRDTLLSCITRRAVELRLSPDPAYYLTSMSHTGASENRSSPMRTVIRLIPSDGILRDIVHYMYLSIKRGSIEPNESFLRVSKRFDQQHALPRSNENLRPVHNSTETLQLSDDGCVLVNGGCHSHDPEKSPSEFCLYIVNGDPTILTSRDIAERTKRTFETRDIYHTTQDNGTSNLATLSRRSLERTPWNLRETYGIHSDVPGLASLISRSCGDAPGPRRQGSPRVEDGVLSGSYLVTRTLIPWSDPRRFGRYPESRMFLIYKLISREMRYWREVADAQRTSGTWACALCADVVDERWREGKICFNCFDRLDDDETFDWFRNSLLGEPAFEAPDGGATDGGEESEDELFLDELPSLNVRWNRALRAYPALEERFHDMDELLAQCDKFTEWSDQRRQERRRRYFKRRQKRPMLEEDSESNVAEDSLGSSSSVANAR